METKKRFRKVRRIALAFSLLLGIGAGLGACSSLTSAEKAARAAETARQVAERLDARQYTVCMEYVTPQRMYGHPIGPEYYIRVSGDTLESYLPYFGRAFGPLPYDGGMGLNFTALLDEYQVVRKKKNRTDVSMSVHNDEDRYLYRLEVYDSGEASLYISALKHDFIGFNGYVETDE